MRCADSLSIRQFLHYELHEATPDHSSLTVIRKRLGSEVHEKVFKLVLKALRDHKLLRGRKLGIDASVMEANASMGSLEHRLTGEDYQKYVSGLAEEADVDPLDPAAVRNFDRKRKGPKTSNDTWQNPHDPDAKIGRTKQGTTRMIYKPEHVVDLETGAIVDADVRPGDEHDTADLTEKVLEVEARLNDVMEEDKNTERVELVAADKGYFKLEEVYLLQGVGIETAISDPQRNRRIDRLSDEDREVLEAARGLVSSDADRGCMRKRSELVERGFQHVLDSRGARRMTLRGRENIRNLYLIKAACANLSLLLRHLAGGRNPETGPSGGSGPCFCLLPGHPGCFQPRKSPVDRVRPPGLPANPFRRLDRRCPTEDRGLGSENGVVQRPAKAAGQSAPLTAADGWTHFSGLQTRVHPHGGATA